MSLLLMLAIGTIPIILGSLLMICWFLVWLCLTLVIALRTSVDI